LPAATLACGLIVAAIVPYLAASLALRTFNSQSLLWILVLAAAASFWYVWLPRKPAADILFLIFMASMMLLKVFPRLYLSPDSRLPLSALGQLMWFRTGLFAMVSIRRLQGVAFGFWPTSREWKIGAAYYAEFLPLAAALAWKINFARPRMPASGALWTSFLVIVIFFGSLWVLALGEEFLFRGLLQQWMTTWLGNEWAGLIATSLLFGAVHLWYHAFPNWRYAALAALLGLFCGLAFRQARSIRASMVTHALVVTTWRIFFS
jgi:membrane protease YdiL (CAAX protease family)